MNLWKNVTAEQHVKASHSSFLPEIQNGRSRKKIVVAFQTFPHFFGPFISQVAIIHKGEGVKNKIFHFVIFEWPLRSPILYADGLTAFHDKSDNDKRLLGLRSFVVNYRSFQCLPIFGFSIFPRIILPGFRKLILADRAKHF